jgi:hypothetical protein
MPQLSSTDMFLMDSNDMTNKLKHSNPGVLFAHVGDDTITALSQLVAIFKNKFQKPFASGLVQAPMKAAENKQPAALVQPIVTSPMKHNYQTRSHRPANVNQSRNSPLLPRVVTPVTMHVAYQRVPAQTKNLSSRNLSQDDFVDMGTANQASALRINHWTQQHYAHTVVYPVMGK